MEIYVISVIVAMISCIIAIMSYVRVRELSESIDPMVNDLAKSIGEALREHVDKELGPFKNTQSRVFSEMGSKGVTQRQLNKADELMATDLLNLQDPLIQAGLEAFPNLKDWLMDGRIHLLPQILPRIQALRSTGDVLGFLKPGDKQLDKPKDKEWAWRT